MKKIEILLNLKTFRTTFFAIMLFVFGSGILMAQTTVTIYSSADNSPDEIAPTTNYGSCDRVFLTGASGTRSRGLFKFDLSSIPAGATISSGTLYLYRILGTGSGNVNVHRVTTDWTEGTATCLGTAGMVSNWNQRTSGTNWSTAGGDYNANVEATTNVPATTYTTNSWNVQGLIQGWVSGSYANYGLILKEADESAYNQMTFATREYTGTANDARLVITYTTSTTTKTWTGNISTDWATAGNWSPSSVPVSGDTVSIPTSPSGGRFPTLSGPSSNQIWINTLDIKSGATFTQTGSYFFLLKDLMIRSGSTYNQQSGNLLLYNDWINKGTFTSVAGWVTIGNQTSLSDFATGVNEFYDLSISTGESPKFDNYPSSLIKIKGGLYNYGNYSVSSDATFLFNGTETQEIYNQTAPGNAVLGNFVIDKNSGSVILRTSLLEISGNATVTNGIFNIDTCGFKRTILGGSLSLNNNSTLILGGTKTIPTSFATRTFAPTSTVDYSGTNQTVSSLDYGNLILSGSGTKTFAAGTVAIGGDLDVRDLAVVDALTYNDTVEYYGTNKTVRYGFVNKNLQISGDCVVTSNTDLSATNSLVINTGGTLNMNGYALNVNGIIVNNGNYVSTNPIGSMSFYSKSSGDLNSLGSWANSGYAGTTTTRLPGTVNNDVLIIGNNKTINLTSNVSNLGTVRIDSSGTLSQSGGTASTKDMQLKNGGNLNQSGGELQISHDLKAPTGSAFSSTAGTVRFVGAMDGQTIYTGNVQLNNLIVDASSDYKLDSGDEIKISGNYTNNNPSLDNNAGTLNFNGTSPQTIFSASSPASTNTMAGNLAVSNPNVTLLSDIGIQTSLNIINGGHINKNGNEIYLNGVLYTGPTPVELVSFVVSVKNNSALLSWKTATEVNNYGFEIERSSNDVTFTRYSFVQGSGNSNSDKHYTFADNNLQNGTYYYRLKQIDTDGEFNYSNVVKATIDYTPNSFSLSQNYPNPFNPSTKISWQSPISGWQTLKVYDILGNEVATLVDEFREAGFYEIEFSAKGGSASGRNGSQLSSGVYIYKINAGSFSDTKKMILNK